MPEVPQNITREHILKAIERIDREGIPSNAYSSTHDVLVEGKSYPPKLVISWANIFANGEELEQQKFGGGKEKDCFKLLEKEGFLITEQDGVSGLYELWDGFLTEWPESRLKEMSLDDYTGIGNHDAFCYWVEKRLETLGSIWGGSSFKFGIYRRGDQKPKPAHPRYTYTEEFAWESKFGDSATQAFETVKNHILTIVNSIKRQDLQTIENIPLWPVFKWKIAFLFQDKNSPLLPAVFKAEMLSYYMEIEHKGQNTPFPALYHWVMKERNDRDIITFGKDIWTKADKIAANKRFKPEDAEQLLLQRYLTTAEGTDKVIGFLNDSGRAIALNRTGKSVRLTMESWEPAIKQIKVKKRYSKNDTRNSNLDSQAPRLALGNEAITVECETSQSFETLLDEYEMIETKEQELPNFEVGAEPRGTHFQPLNQILYGPPGTGKTYHTINAALKILDPEFYYANINDRKSLKHRFNQLRDEEKIGFVTFHQSFSYEDFVEGIKAVEVDGSISYEVVGGIFRSMCEEQELEIDSASSVDITGRAVWKMSLGNTLGSDSYIYDHCIENDELRLGWGRNIDFTSCDDRQKIVKLLEENGFELDDQDYRATAVNTFKNKMKVGDLVVVTEGNMKFRAIAEIKADYECLPSSELGNYAATRKVIWHRVYENSVNYEKLMHKKFSQMTIYKLKPKAINLTKLSSLLSGSKGNANVTRVTEGQSFSGGNHIVQSVSDEIVRIRSQKTNSTISFDRKLIDELKDYINQGKLTIDDIASKSVFDKVDTNLEKYIVNGYPGLLSKILEQLTTGSDSSIENKGLSSKNKVLIIDEINRGNISSIFGELITLLEPSKRKGAEEELSATLPYSKELLTVPKELHIIGTMNTADRSLALMDTALRRRFDFQEMMPDAILLADLVFEGINVQEMLERMNERIQVLYDREHTIGHAFFIGLFDIEEDKRFAELQNIFSSKILPLLEEYFFEDWQKIRLVLGDNQKEEAHQFVRLSKDYNAQQLFGDVDDYNLIDEEVKVYSRYTGDLSPEAFRLIYER